MSETGIETIIRNYGSKKHAVIMMLQDIQDKYNFLPQDVLRDLSRTLEVPLSRIYSIATYYKLFSVEELLEVIRARPDNVEIVVTGRKAEPALLEEADLVTEMREVKHYYSQGVVARSGIEK